LLVALATACGGEHTDRRSHGLDGAAILPRKISGADAQGQPSPGTPDAPSDDQASTDQTPTVQQTLVTAGLRNYDQVNATMATLTGIPRTNAAVVTSFNTLATSLPTETDVKAFIGSQQVSIYKLAVSYCDELINDTANAAQRTAVFGSFNFSAPLSSAFNAAGQQAFADIIITKFWGKDLASLPPHDASVKQATDLIAALLQGKDMTSTKLTPAVATAVCTAALASAPVTMF